MTQTPNYKLTQWNKRDRIQMESFNQDNAKIDAALKAHDTAIAGKAAQSALKAETAARTSAIAALNATVAKLGNCLLYHTTYTGTGTASAAKPIVITFPRRPSIVAINDYGSYSAWAAYGVTSTGVGMGPGVRFEWSGNTLSFYGSIEGHLDSTGTTYHVTALLDASQ